MRNRLARRFTRHPSIRAWVELPPGHVDVVLQRDPRVLRVKTPRGNGYLVLGPRVVAIDPNLPGEERLFAAALAGEGLALDRLDHVGCTHLHFDHASGLDSLAAAAGATLLLPRTMRRYVQGRAPLPYPGLAFAWPFVETWGRVGFPGVSASQLRGGGHVGYPWSANRVRTEVAGWLDDGEAAPELSGLVPLHTPGHTPEHTCYLHADSGTLLAGDMYITMRGHLEPNRIKTDAAAQRRSDERLRALGVRRVWPGHGPPMDLV